ncbi:MAG: YjbH domain-containing protein [Tannerella sp.]|jgi:hypothetical protein|nr:YjbH domain-containing protein [Tannerella sp.]
MTGLLNTPSADMQPDGLFMAGGNFLPEEMMPDMWDYNSGNYFLNITFLPFVEVAYRCTLFKGEYKAGNKWQQDRSVSIRLRPLKERRFLPSVVVGSNDAFTTNEINTFKETNGNRYFSSVYVVATKNIPFGGNVLGITAGSYLFSKNSLYKGIFGGIRFTPSFLKPVSVIAEYDSNNVNVGVTARWFNHLSVHVFAYDFKAVSCGLRYEFQLLNK